MLGNDEPIASVVGEIVPLKADWYDFASKYDDGGMELVVPARITAEADRARAQELAVAGVRRLAIARAWRESTCSSATTARCSSTS